MRRSFRIWAELNAYSQPRTRRSDGGAGQRSATADHIGGLLRNHDHRRVDVAADEIRHHRCIDHKQLLGAEDAQIAVDHGQVVGRHTHLARPQRVMNGDAGLHDVRIQIRIGSRQRRELFPNKGAQGPLMVSVLPLDGPPKRRMQKSGAFPMPSHKFKIGDVVTLKPAISRNVPGGTYQVT
jgi:hypothetical protein